MSSSLTQSELNTTARSTADGRFTAFVLGVFAAAWFGWSHGGAPTQLGTYLTVAAMLSVIVAIVGGVLTLRHRSELTAARDKAASAQYGRRVGLTYLVIGVGVAVLVVTDQPKYVAPWVGFIVGAHFWILVDVLRDRLLVPLGIVVVAVSTAAVVVGLTTSVPPNVVAGTGIGIALLTSAATNLLARSSERAATISPL